MKASPFTPEERQARAARLCRRLAQDVAAVCPPGIGMDPRAWEAVEAASTAFLDELKAWELGEFTDAERLRPLYYAVVQAWEGAARAFEARQTPAAEVARAS